MASIAHRETIPLGHREPVEGEKVRSNGRSLSALQFRADPQLVDIGLIGEAAISLFTRRLYENAAAISVSTARVAVGLLVAISFMAVATVMIGWLGKSSNSRAADTDVVS